ncbi:MAG: hypothetical protein L0229_08295 [Blastocatellia bacterium]|nr:hypothetical protein [Blastocatellia bacterium]
MKRITRSTSLLIILSAGSWAYAHTTSLKIDKKAATPGETITLTGKGIGSGSEIKIIMQGVARDYPLGEAQGDEHGQFEKQVTLSGDVQPGTYTVIASSGNKKATARLVIEAAVAQETDPQKDETTKGGSEHRAEQSGHGEGEMAGMEHARAEPMEIQRSRSVVETIAMWSIVLVSSLLGIGLLIRERGK